MMLPQPGPLTSAWHPAPLSPRQTRSAALHLITAPLPRHRRRAPWMLPGTSGSAAVIDGPHGTQPLTS
jgi:hypothetical protein